MLLLYLCIEESNFVSVPFRGVSVCAPGGRNGISGMLPSAVMIQFLEHAVTIWDTSQITVTVFLPIAVMIQFLEHAVTIYHTISKITVALLCCFSD